MGCQFDPDEFHFLGINYNHADVTDDEIFADGSQVLTCSDNQIIIGVGFTQRLLNRIIQFATRHITLKVKNEFFCRRTASNLSNLVSKQNFLLPGMRNITTASLQEALPFN